MIDSTSQFDPIIGRELLQYECGGYPWDRWAMKAREAGVSKELVQLGRDLMREAVQHSWSARLQEECGWVDDGETMIELALRDPDAAGERWEYLMRTDGERV